MSGDAERGARGISDSLTMIPCIVCDRIYPYTRYSWPSDGPWGGRMPSSSSLTGFVLTAFGSLLINGVPAPAACNPGAEPDETDIASARSAVAANCDCA